MEEKWSVTLMRLLPTARIPYHVPLRREPIQNEPRARRRSPDLAETADRRSPKV